MALLKNFVRHPDSESVNVTTEASVMFEDMFTTFGADNVLDEFRRLTSQMDQLFNYSESPAGIRAAQRGAFPPINVGATPEQIDVYVFAANMESKSIDLSIQQNLLSISGTRKVEVDEKANYYRRERFDGDFRRTITLPDDVDPERVQAKYRDGVLHITIQRREAARPRQITVN
jgi:HSP20 family protein